MLALEVGVRVSSMWPPSVTYYMQVTCSSFRSSFKKNIIIRLNVETKAIQLTNRKIRVALMPVQR